MTFVLEEAEPEGWYISYNVYMPGSRKIDFMQTGPYPASEIEAQKRDIESYDYITCVFISESLDPDRKLV